MRLVEGVLPSDLDRRANDLIPEVLGEDAPFGHFADDAVPQVRTGDQHVFDAKNLDQFAIGQQCRAERLRLGEWQVVLADELILGHAQDAVGELREIVAGNPCQRGGVPVGLQLPGREPDVPSQRDEFDRAVGRSVLPQSAEYAVRFELHDLADFGLRCPQELQRLSQAQRTEPVRVRKRHVAVLDNEHFRIAASDLDNDGW